MHILCWLAYFMLQNVGRNIDILEQGLFQRYNRRTI